MEICVGKNLCQTMQVGEQRVQVSFSLGTLYLTIRGQEGLRGGAGRGVLGRGRAGYCYTLEPDFSVCLEQNKQRSSARGARQIWEPRTEQLAGRDRLDWGRIKP